MSLDLTTTFAGQVSLSHLVQNILYASGAVGAIFVAVGLLLVDSGGIRRRNVFNATIEKLIGFFIGFTTYFFIGFSFWAAQYYIMVDGTLTDSIKDWWAGGTLANAMAHKVDPAVFPGVNNFQIFIFFLGTFAGIVNILLHFAVSERMKASAYYITCVVATIVSSILSWWTWGSVGPLSNAGFHDFFGVGFVYMFPAGMALVFSRVLGQRPGMFTPHPDVTEYLVPNLGLATTGIMLVFAGLPMVILSCLYFVDPEAMALSVTMAETSVGIAFNNYGAAWAGGTLTGALIAYRKRKYSYLLLGPLAGYVAGAPGFDVYVPWKMFMVAMGAPFVAYFVYELTQKLHIDEHKLIPLFGGVGSYGLIMVALVAGGTPHGGYIGITEGPYAFQHAEISLVMQLAGIVTCLGTGVITALILTPILKALTGLYVSDEDQVKGLDMVIWGIQPDVEPHSETSAVIDASAVGVHATQT